MLSFFFVIAAFAAPRFILEPVLLPEGESVIETTFAPDSDSLVVRTEQRIFLSDGTNMASEVTNPLVGTNGFGIGMSACGMVGQQMFFCQVIFAGGETYDAATIAGVESVVHDFNHAGEFVGTARDAANNHAAFPFLWRAGRVYKLNDLLNQQAGFDKALVVNDHGVIYGARYIYGVRNEAMLVRLTPDGLGKYDLRDVQQIPHDDLRISKDGRVATRGLYWSEHTGMVPFDLGVRDSAWAYVVNALGQVAGLGYVPHDESVHAFFWDGQIYDLNEIVTAPAGWTLYQANDINEYGQIAVHAYTGERHAALRLTPEPAMAVRPIRGQTVEAIIRPGSKRPIALQVSLNLREWLDLRTWAAPGPLETEQVTSGNAAFLRVVRK